jgi:hypothetical protein
MPGRKKALLVGVNDFKDASISRLNGCVNDALNIRATLKEFFGFTNTDIHVLTNARATKPMIFDRLYSLQHWAQPGDLVVFSFSAHGSQIRDRHGDELGDELDELFCPYDMSWDDGTFILDDEMAQICNQFRAGVQFEVIMDTCHSATMLKGVNSHPSMKNMSEYAIQPRFTPPPLDIFMRQEGEESCMDPTKKIMRSLSANDKILWAACKSHQTSADAYIGGSYNGAFTHAFCKAIRNAKGSISRKALIHTINMSLNGAGFDQIPQLEGTDALFDKNVFSI